MSELVQATPRLAAALVAIAAAVLAPAGAGGGELWHLEVDDGLDFATLEDDAGERHLHPVAALTGFRVEYEQELDCVRDRIERALEAFAGLDAAALDFDLDPAGSAPWVENSRGGNLWGDPLLWRATPEPTIRILIVDGDVPDGAFTGPGRQPFVPLGATGAIYAWDSGAWVFPRLADSTLPEYAVLTLRRSNYPTATLAACTGNLPSTEVIAHEIGHALGFGEQRFLTDPALSVLENPTAVPNVYTTNSPSERGGVFKLGAYAQRYLRHFYPKTPSGEPDWVAHDEVLRRDPFLADRRVVPLSIYQFAELNPEHLVWDGDDYEDCTTRRPPRFFVQLSEVSTAGAPLPVGPVEAGKAPGAALPRICAPTTRLELFVRGPAGHAVASSQTIGHECDDAYHEYQYDAELTLTPALLADAGHAGPPQSSGQELAITVGARVNPAGAAGEWNPDDNEVLTEVVLHAADTADPRCARIKVPPPSGLLSPRPGDDPATDGRFGRTVASTKRDSGARQVVAVGAPRRLVDGETAGAVTVTEYDSAGTVTWGPFEIRSPAGPGGQFGRAVALNRDGTRLAVGAPGADADDGKVYVYVRNAAAYDLVQTIGLTLGGVAGRFGAAVAMTEKDLDGATGVGLLFVGQPAIAGAASVSVYRWDGAAAYSSIIGFTAGSDQTDGDRFGAALDADDQWLVVGAPESSAGTAGAGAAFAYPLRLSAADLAEPLGDRQPIYASDAAAGDEFGAAVSVHSQVLVVGAPGHDDERGAAYFYGQPFDRGHLLEWDEAAVVTLTGAAGGRRLGDRFGAAVDNYRGNVLVGAPRRDLNAFGALPLDDAGAAFLYRPRVTDTFLPWRAWSGFGGGDRAADDRYGRGVALGALFWVVGAPRADVGLGPLVRTDAGAVRRGPYRTLHWYW